MIKINIAIDGYSSCGKSTIARFLSKQLQYTYVDTGALYRGVALYLLEQGHSSTDLSLLDYDALFSTIRLSFGYVDGVQHLFLNDQDVESKIRMPAVSKFVPFVSSQPKVREHITTILSEITKQKGVIMDGRDIGTVVMPDAELKLFVIASPEVRAHRRFEELIAKGVDTTLAEVLSDIKERDDIDTHRAVSPLVQASDAIVIDNSSLTLEEQNNCIWNLVQTTINRARSN